MLPPRLRHADSGGVEVEQLSRDRTRRSPPCRSRDDNPSSTQGATIIGKLLFPDPNGAPVAGAHGCRVHPLTRAERYEFSGSDLDPAPDG